ncbi:MAG: APC family permease [Gammaproteobacteria bacterium]|nr:amino acid permease [Pseudomonadales bacterium]MCP5347720.1 amino acid permease [Pseudomonadales bacterium]
MHTTQGPIGFWSAVSMGIGAMVGAGIFALLGEASAIAGSAVYLSFLIGGGVALASAYSLGRLGAALPSSGGIIEYLTQAYGIGYFSGSMSIMLYLSALVSLSLIAEAFANYATTFLPDGASPVWQPFFSTAIVVLFVLINLRGAKDVAIWERLTVAVKFLVLVAFSIIGIAYANPDLLSPGNYPASNNIFYSLAVTFFAFEGFRVITNTAEDMPDPARTLPRSMMAAVFIVMLLYVAISFAVFGNLPVDEVIAARDFALAQAALPLLGHTGFTIVTVTALIATASAINANLYSVTNVTYQLAKDGELPEVFGEPIAHSREGLIISGTFVILLTLLFDLSIIAAVGSISVLFVHTVTHVGHLKIIARTAASRLLVILAALLCFAAMLLALVYVLGNSGQVGYILIAFLVFSVVTEVILRKLFHRKVKPRLLQVPASG